MRDSRKAARQEATLSRHSRRILIAESRPRSLRRYKSDGADFASNGSGDERSKRSPREHQGRAVWILGVAHRHETGEVCGDSDTPAIRARVRRLVPGSSLKPACTGDGCIGHV